jgi:signal transduction histidine kinase
VAAGLTSTLDELREYARGIHPAILADGGLAPALKTLARRSPLPVTLDLQLAGRLPDRVEITAYYVVSEALANAAKHAAASAVHIAAGPAGDVIRLAVHDDGDGGADPARGSGLAGLKDRVEAIGGTLSMRSRPGEGTSLLAELPTLPGHPPRPPARTVPSTSSPAQARPTTALTAAREPGSAVAQLPKRASVPCQNPGTPPSPRSYLV